MGIINIDKIPLAFFDIQAYSTFIQKNSKDECIKKTEDLLQTVKRDAGSFIQGYKVNHWILSDSIIVIPDLDERPLDLYSIDFLFLICSDLLYRGLKASLPLRGAIGSGYFYKNNDVIVSSALVDAARHEKEQNWLGAVITSSALSLMTELRPTFMNEYASLYNFGRTIRYGSVPWKISKNNPESSQHPHEFDFYIKPINSVPNWRQYLPAHFRIDDKVASSDCLYEDARVYSR